MGKASSEHFACESLSSLLYPSLINVVSVTLHSSYPIAVSSKWFCSQLVSFTFCASIFPIHPITGEGEEEAGKSKQQCDWDTISLGALNCGVSFPNHDIKNELLWRREEKREEGRKEGS